MRRRLTNGALVLCALALAGGLSGCYSKPGAGETGVVRNGGPLDNHKIRQIVPNGAGNTWVGLFSSTHYYPVSSQQRFFRMATCYDKNDTAHRNPFVCPGADGLAVTVPTADGVEVTISGTLYLNTLFDGSPSCRAGQVSTIARPCGGIDALKAFDTQFSTRTFDGEHPYDGSSGWSKFLAAIVEPIIQNNMRQTVAGIRCAELVSSCSLIQNGPAGQNNLKVTPAAGNSNVQKIEVDINSHLAEDLRQTLGRDYFQNLQFRLGGAVQLPVRVQDAIDSAQAAFADITRAQAEATANETKQHGYNTCPTCAAIDQTKAIPGNITVWAPGSNASIAVGKR